MDSKQLWDASIVYQGVQRAREEPINILINGGKERHMTDRKYQLLLSAQECSGRESVKFKEYRTGVIGALYKALKRRERQGDVIIVTVGEFRASRVKKRYSLILIILIISYRYATLAQLPS